MSFVIAKLKSASLLILFVLTFAGFSLSQDNTRNEKLDSLIFAYFENNDFEKAEKTAQEVLKNNLLDTNIYSVNANTILGIINKNRGFYISSTEHYLSALNDARSIKDSGRQSEILNNLGTLYKLQNNYNKAITYFSESLELERRISEQNIGQQSIRYYNLADTYLAMDSLDLALSHFNNSLLLEQKMNNREGLLYAYLGIIDVYFKMGNAFQSTMMLEKVNQFLPVKNIELNVLYTFTRSKYNFLQNDLDEADAYVNEALNMAQENHLEFLLPELLSFKIDILRKQEKWEQLSETYQTYFDMKEQYNSQMIKSKIDDLNYQNELNNKQIEVQTLRLQKKAVEEEMNMQNKVKLFQGRLLIFILALLLLTIIFMFFGVKKLRQINTP
jgi:tetratricopeptide (TPR) repeat protein